jgi:methylmalonyl-CoA/ethylmalonyl-CoA epimerase
MKNQVKSFFAVVVAVNNLEEAINNYQKLGFELLKRIANPEWGLAAAQLKVGDMSVVELISPVDSAKAVAQTVRNFLDRKGEGVYEVAIEVEDIEAMNRVAREGGARVVAEPVSSPIQPDTKIMWISPKSANGVFLQFMNNSHLLIGK